MKRNCEICGNEFDAPSKRRTCSTSCRSALAWKDPVKSAKRRASIEVARRTPESRARSTEANHRRWAQPGEREKLSEWNRDQWANPKTRKKLSAAIQKAQGSPGQRAFYSRLRTEQWANDPEYRRRTTEGIQKSKGTPEYRALFSRLLKERWDDPAWRKKYSDGIRREMNRPERKAQCSARMREMWATDEKFRAAVAASMEHYWSQPGSREAARQKQKALWADPIWKMQTMEMMAINPGAAIGGKIYRHLKSAADLMSEVDAVIPAGLPDFMRMDIASDITLALLEGQLRLSNLKTEARAYMTAHRKMFPDKWGPISIDAPLPGTDGFTLADTLSNDTPHF